MIKLLNDYAPIQFHSIACYDSKSHLMVRSPEEWLRLFKSVDANYHIYDIVARKKSKVNKVVVITKGI